MMGCVIGLLGSAEHNLSSFKSNPTQSHKDKNKRDSLATPAIIIQIKQYNHLL